MVDNFADVYYSGMSPEKLAEKVISISYGEIMRSWNWQIQRMSI